MESTESSHCEEHRADLSLSTQQGRNSICLVCISNVITAPRAPTLHVSYALSQVSSLQSSFNSFHACFLVSPLVEALSSFDDQPITCQIIDLITSISQSHHHVFPEFVFRVANKLSSGALAWSRKQLYMASDSNRLILHIFE